jgi:hypothetical protein
LGRLTSGVRRISGAANDLQARHPGSAIRLCGNGSRCAPVLRRFGVRGNGLRVRARTSTIRCAWPSSARPDFSGSLTSTTASWRAPGLGDSVCVATASGGTPGLPRLLARLRTPGFRRFVARGDGLRAYVRTSAIPLVRQWPPAPGYQPTAPHRQFPATNAPLWTTNAPVDNRRRMSVPERRLEIGGRRPTGEYVPGESMTSSSRCQFAPSRRRKCGTGTWTCEPSCLGPLGRGRLPVRSPRPSAATPSAAHRSTSS